MQGNDLIPVIISSNKDIAVTIQKVRNRNIIFQYFRFIETTATYNISFIRWRQQY